MRCEEVRGLISLYYKPQKMILSSYSLKAVSTLMASYMHDSCYKVRNVVFVFHFLPEYPSAKQSLSKFAIYFIV